MLPGVIAIAVGTKPSLYAEFGVIASVNVEDAAVVAVAATVVVVSEKPAMLAGEAVVLLELATYIKSVDVVQSEVHWLSGGKNPQPVRPIEIGAAIRPSKQTIFQNLCITGLSRVPFSKKPGSFSSLSPTPHPRPGARLCRTQA